MKYFKRNNDVFAFELDGSQDHLITEDMVYMSEDEIYAHLNPIPTDEQVRLARIAELQKMLKDTDYMMLADYVPPEGRDMDKVRSDRTAWRTEIRQLLNEGE